MFAECLLQHSGCYDVIFHVYVMHAEPNILVSYTIINIRQMQLDYSRATGHNYSGATSNRDTLVQGFGPILLKGSVFSSYSLCNVVAASLSSETYLLVDRSCTI